MPNVFSKLVLPEWALSTVPYINNIFRQYGKYRTTIQRSIIFVLILRSTLSIRRLILAMKKKETTKAPKESGTRKKKVEVDVVFFRQLYKLLQIVMPGLRSKEFWLLVLHSGFLGIIHVVELLMCLRV
ncbi:hypothetical protein BCV72DRAFT_66342 [Rhizopus microsporus var. microsporus]|uniref:Peroxisomal membrane protein PEX16 n=1 Tax=Rhizopus microsporus var. microsporus TaxID=86635 RepID=A0A1X0RBA6_RHIZD|nr:hypothetical protein BCV72DRAFT_66342 [Rhizopus microsporus var. microsporus]